MSSERVNSTALSPSEDIVIPGNLIDRTEEKEPLNFKMATEDGKAAVSDDSSNKVKFIPSAQATQNGEAKIEIDSGRVAFAGMGKEELMRFANDPFWVRLRWTLFVLFWLGWIGMLVGAIAIIILAPKCESPAPKEYWQKEPVYEIYVRSFQDGSKDDGIGDLKGVLSHVDYLHDLGVGTVWLSPIFKSPMVDFGYDISNYTEIDEGYGTLEDFEMLVKALKQKGIQVVLDFVPNHSSDKHAWFLKSVLREGNYTDYYVWRDSRGNDPDGKPIVPNNWLSVFGGSAWEFNEQRGQFYLHQFTKGQPDLNVTNPLVVDELKNVLRFWLNRGVAGFRMDAVAHLFEDPDFRDEPLSGKPGATSDEYDYLNHPYTFNLQPQVANLLAKFRAVLDEFEATDDMHRVMMTEAYVPVNDLVQYYTTNDGSRLSDMPFNFLLMNDLKMGFSAGDLHQIIQTWFNASGINWPNWVMGNHDNSRVATRLGADMVDPINMLLLLLPGTPVTYYGEEIGMTDTYITFDQSVDPAALNAGAADYMKHTRDPERTPMQWNDSPNAGFTAANVTPWLPVNHNYTTVNVESQLNDSTSHLNIYKSLAALRKEESILNGDFEMRIINTTFAFTRIKKGTNSYLVAINLGEEPHVPNLKIFQDVPDKGTIVVYTTNVSDLKENVPFDEIELGKNAAVVVRFIST